MNNYEEKLLEIKKNVISFLNLVTLPENPAMVFDIDQTLIDEKQNCIQPIIDIYNYAKDMNIALFIITSRPGMEPVISMTKKTLLDCNIMGVKAMFFRPYNKVDHTYYKKSARKAIYDRFNHNVIMSIGDSTWDIGEYGGEGVLVPIN